MQLTNEMKEYFKERLDIYTEEFSKGYLYGTPSHHAQNDLLTKYPELLESKTHTVKRSKAVDVPTEQWQKSVERNQTRAEDRLDHLLTYLKMAW